MKTPIFLKDVRANQLDKLIDSLSQRLPEEQMDYIKANIKLDRYPLFKAFKKKFGSTIKKPQFNANVERAREELTTTKVKQPYQGRIYDMPQVKREPNVGWVKKQGIWEVKFRKDGKSNILGRFYNHDEAVKVALEYRKRLEVAS